MISKGERVTFKDHPGSCNDLQGSPYDL
jgi:hypothetical protein